MPETETWRYRGQTIDREQIAFLREFIREHPDSSRWKLSRQLCEALDWKQANGALSDVVCRGLMLMLQRAGEIELPPVRRQIRGQRRTARPRPEAILIDTTPLKMPLGALGAIEIQLVRRTADEPLFESLMEEYHYLRYEQPVGEHLKYLVWAALGPAAGGLSGVEFGAAAPGEPRPVHRLERRGSAAQHPIPRLQHTLSDSPVGRSAAPGVAHPRPHGPADLAGLGAHLRAPDLFSGNLHRSGDDSAGPVIGRRTGYCWGGPRGEAKTIRPIGRTGRSKKCWHFHSIAGFTSYYRTCK